MFFKILDFLSLKLKLHMAILIFLIFFKGILELASISSVPFLILYLINPKKIDVFFSKYDLGFSADFLSNLQLETVVFIVIIIFFIKLFFFFLINIYEEKFHYNTNIKFRLDLFRHYLKLPFLDLIKSNIPIILRNITIEANHLSSAITNLVKIVQNTITILIFLIFLIFVSNNKMLIIFFIF